MSPREGTQSGRIRIPAITGIIFVSVLLVVVLFVNIVGRADRATPSSSLGAPDVVPQGDTSTGPSAPKPQNGQGVVERLDAAPDRTRAGRGSETPTERRYDERGADAGASSQPTRTQRPPTVDVRQSPEGSSSDAPAGGSHAVARGVAPSVPVAAGSRSSAPDVRQGGPGVRDPVASPAPAASQPEGAAPAEAPAVPPVDPSTDRGPPVLVGLRFEPPEIGGGDATTLVIGATDDLSGVQRIVGNLSSPSGTASLPFHVEGDGTATTFSVPMAIPKDAETGLWYVATLYIVDRAGNPLNLRFTPATVPAGGALKVESAQPDSTPPTVHDVRVDKLTLNGGERNPIRVEIDDDRSGVASVTGFFQSPTKAAILPFACHAGEDPAFWEGEVTVPRDADCGTWSLENLRVVDGAGNIAIVSGDSPLIARVEFGVSSDQCDSTPPTLEAFTLTPTAVSNESATDIRVTAVVSDVGSGAYSLNGVASGPAATSGLVPTLFFSCAPPANDPSGAWIGTIVVPRFAAKGLWRVTLVRLQDRALNSREYNAGDPAVAQGVFEVR